MTTPSPESGAAIAAAADRTDPPVLTRLVRECGWVLGRSLFPFVALVLILGTVLWGPWVTLILALVWWHIVTRIG